VAVKKKKSVKKKVKKAKTSSTKKKQTSAKKKAPAKKSVKKKAGKAKKAATTKSTPKKRTAKKTVIKKAASKKIPSPKPIAKAVKKTEEPPEEVIPPVVKSPYEKDDPKLIKIHEGLIQERRRLMGMLRSSQEVERTINDITFSNEIDLASSLEGREMAFQLSSRERNELRMVEEAIFKISAGTYGVCDSCSKHISLKRLEIMPLTALCIECQENSENF